MFPDINDYANYFAIAIITMLVSQTIKFGIKFYLLGKMNFKQFKHIYLWSSGVPSTHTATLMSSFLALYRDLGRDNPLTFIFAVVAILWVYEIYMQRKRFRALEQLFERNDETDPHLVLLKDLEGHDLIDILVGALLGAVIFWTYTRIV